MTEPTYDYSSYRHILCRTCQAQGAGIDVSIQPIVGVLVSGEYLLRCGHQQETGEGKGQPKDYTDDCNCGVPDCPWCY